MLAEDDNAIEGVVDDGDPEAGSAGERRGKAWVENESGPRRGSEPERTRCAGVKVPWRRARALFSVWMFLVGSFLFVPACVIIIPLLKLDTYASDVTFLVGSVTFTVAALVDVIDAHKMVSSEERMSSYAWGRLPAGQESLIQCYMFLAGSILYVIGSSIFMPAVNVGINWGIYTFRGGSVFYIVASIYGLLTQESKLQSLPTATKVQNILGAAFFIAGGQVFLADDYLTGSILWVIGSVFFFLAAVTGVINAQRLPNLEESTK